MRKLDSNEERNVWGISVKTMHGGADVFKELREDSSMSETRHQGRTGFVLFCLFNIQVILIQQLFNELLP